MLSAIFQSGIATSRIIFVGNDVERSDFFDYPNGFFDIGASLSYTASRYESILGEH